MSLVLCISLRKPGTSMGNLSNKLKVRFCNFLPKYYYWIYRFLDKYVYVYRLVCFCVKSLGVPYGHFS